MYLCQTYTQKTWVSTFVDICFRHLLESCGVIEICYLTSTISALNNLCFMLHFSLSHSLSISLPLSLCLSLFWWCSTGLFYLSSLPEYYDPSKLINRGRTEKRRNWAFRLSFPSLNWAGYIDRGTGRSQRKRRKCRFIFSRGDRRGRCREYGHPQRRKKKLIYPIAPANMFANMNLFFPEF